MTICPPRVAQGPVAWAIEGTRAWRADVRDVINTRAALFQETIARVPGWSVSAIGAYFAYIRHPFGGSAELAAAHLAIATGIIVLPGSSFGPGQDDYLRVAIANVDRDEIRAVGHRLSSLH